MALAGPQSNRPFLPAIPRQLPKTQAEWEQVANAFLDWQAAMSPKWIEPTLGTNISYYGSPWTLPGYYMDVSGRVYLRGLVAGAGLVSAATIFTLPAAFAPSYYWSFGVPGSNGSTGGGGIWRVNVTSSGGVQIDATPPIGTTGNPTTYLFLDGISFSTIP